MAILTIINAIPLFSTQAEATAWGASRGLSGFHTHNYNGENGYMAGANHTQAINLNYNILTEQSTINEEDNNSNEEDNNNNINTSYSPPTGGGGY